MILRKEPLIRKQLAILAGGLILMSFLIVINSMSFISQLPGYGTETESNVYSLFMVRSAVVALLLIILNISLFWAIWIFTIRKLERLSLAVDRTMNGDFSAVAHADEEGILSRLESQFYQLSRRLQLSMETITREKDDLKTLVTDISHQIKTPLASIKVFNSLLIDGGLDEQEEFEFLSRIGDQVSRLEWLSASLIKISRMETGMIELKKEPADIAQTILEAVNEVYLRALEKNVDIVIQPLPSVTVGHDARWTREAIVNILENSIKYVNDNGQIKIAMEHLETCVKIDIADNGIGISPQEIGKIFNRFYRGEAAAVKKADGSGIGLYLARKIVEEQGGGIIASSEVGRGTRFTILLTLDSAAKTPNPCSTQIQGDANYSQSGIKTRPGKRPGL